MQSLSILALAGIALAAKCIPKGDPFAIVDKQEWVNPDDMTWADFTPPPGTNWSDPTRKGAARNFNIALVLLDYDDQPFVITQPAGSTVFGNPQPLAANVPHDDVPAFYRDLLNTPSDINQGHTLHEYWMEDSAGKYGVDLTAFGAYRMPNRAFQYGIDDWMNPGSCPGNATCNVDIRTDGLNLWREDVGDDVADAFELVFILSAGQDESGTWQEFGIMKWADSDDVPDAFGPPADIRDDDDPNSGTTRYVPWTSWASAASIWPNAGGGSSTQAESSGMGVYAHELSHLLDIGDNYNNPYGDPLRRSFTGSWSMMSRGSFNGPGGPHTRWQIPAMQGAAMGSLHTVRDKYQLGLMDEGKLLRLSRDGLAASGLVIARLTARSVESNLMGLRVQMGEDLAPACDTETDVFCDGGGYDNYEMEVVDRMGADSFQPDAGVMLSKSKDEDRQPFQWMIDANPEDIALVDYVSPSGEEVMITLGDYRQLADALFHAGTRSGSAYEHVDEANGLHFYVLGVQRDKEGVLSYVVGVRALAGSGASEFGVTLKEGHPIGGRGNTPTTKGVFCSFDLTNSGSYVEGGEHPDDASEYLGSDIFRLEASVNGEGWRVEVPNALVAAKFGETVSANVAVGATEDAEVEGVVTLTVTSESDGEVKATAECRVSKE
ncbi:uncharacterized protein F5Z01DRAFT_293306 [Emericellopsis atlantica]|uniref:Peptidase M6-like domain-containing protein n=1 Tax=Emericellopsis atlantica TaxID=2614577 RepID=A0A9P7ZH34_9HYPO|nr:uncharacterized protein F5Z01DRAFT_293306 [Emericellopsis atlantica]KAG9251343.1 hypothetical protein F5Z01DRAFT_293306 [Emericellopsis atlantica]